jgi:hypothetical protein
MTIHQLGGRDTGADIRAIRAALGLRRYYPQQDYINLVNGASLNTNNTGAGTAISVGTSVPESATAVALRLAVSSTTAGAWLALGPDNDDDASKYHLAVFAQVASRRNENNGIVTINANTARRLYYFRDVQSGTLTWWLYVVGWFV